MTVLTPIAAGDATIFAAFAVGFGAYHWRKRRNVPNLAAAGPSLDAGDSARLEADLERYDLGWFVACLCTPLAGEDLAARLPRYRPTPLLARETNGDLGDLLPGWREQLERSGTEQELRALTRRVARRVVRTGFTLVMPRWGGWTSDLRESAKVFGRYYPARRTQMLAAAEAGRTRAADRPLLGVLIGDLGPWLAAEYVRVHGRKAPRPHSPG